MSWPDSGSRGCPACGSQRLKAAFSAGPRFLRCRDCASMFDPYPPGPDQLREIYSGEDYFVKEGDGGGSTLRGYPKDYVANRRNVEGKFGEALGHLERYVSQGLLLDVGSGPGFLLTVARDRGWEPIGVDLNEWAVGYGRTELGLDIRLGQLGALDFDESSFTAVTMMDLIEHLPDPEPVVAEAARIVMPGGALAILTPDAGSRVSKLLGARWPEVRRPGEHAVLFSVAGLTRLLARHGFVACGWHSIGKKASLSTLISDVSPVAPSWMGRVGGLMAGSTLGERELEFDPRTKFCLYARRLPKGGTPGAHAPARVRKHPDDLSSVEGAILEELEHLAAAERYGDWLFNEFAGFVRGSVAEVGAGTGTFSRRILDAGAQRLLAIEPEPGCAELLESRFGDDERVMISSDELPHAPSLTPADFDLVVCQNVLEHIGDDSAAVATMARALAPGGRLALIVPARPSLYGPLDEAYGHWRRYTKAGIRDLMSDAGLEVENLHPLNALGIPAWWAKNRRPGARVGRGSLSVFELVLPAWRPIEQAVAPPVGLTLVCVARQTGG